MEKTLPLPADTDTKGYIRLSTNQALILILSIVSVIYPLIFSAGNYTSQFENLKAKVSAVEANQSEVTKSLISLTIEIKSLRNDMENVNQRRSRTDSR